MGQKSKVNFYFFASLICAIWFAVTGYLWVYYANFIISFPFAGLSLLCWHYGKKIDPNPKRYNIVFIVLGIGALVSIGFLFLSK
jgi:hypothetical protein